MNYQAIIKSKRILFYSLIVTALFESACSNEENDKFTTPPTTEEEKSEPEKGSDSSILYSELSIKEVMPSDAQTVTLTQTFKYDNGKLTSCQNIQSYTAIETFELSNQTTVTYEGNQIKVTDESGNVSIYTLNEYGYATYCIRNEGTSNERKYRFSYDIRQNNQHYLTQIEEYLSDNTMYAKIILKHTDNIINITQHIDSSIQIYIAGTPKSTNIVGIPHPFLIELHPLSMHITALYGRWLGEPYAMMFTQIVPEGNEERVDYIFETDTEGWFTKCQITTKRTNYYQHTRNISYTYTR